MSAQTTYAPALDDALFGSLRQVCEPHARPGEATARPFSAEFDGEPCTVATNGRVMFIVRGVREDVGPYVGKHREGVRRYLDPQPITKGSWHFGVDFAALREWMISPGVACKACGGTGRKQAAGHPEAQWFGALFGVRVNREQVAPAFTRLKADTVDVFLSDKGDGPVIIAADDWRLLWMPFEGSITGLDSFPADFKPASASERPADNTEAPPSDAAIAAPLLPEDSEATT